MRRLCERLMYAVGILYVVVGMIAFGYSAAAADRRFEREYRECLQHADQICIREGKSRVAVGGVLAGAMWPLYLSWVYFERKY